MEHELPEHFDLEDVIPFVDYNNDFIDKKFEESLDKVLNFDVNNFAQIDAESGDSDIEEDQEEDSASAKVSMVKHKITNFTEKIFCVTQSYTVIHTVTDNKKNTLCHFCYYLYQYYQQGGSHNHVNTHIKRKLKHSIHDLHCELCSRSLYQIILPEVCLLCNSASKTLEADLQTKIPLVPV